MPNLVSGIALQGCYMRSRGMYAYGNYFFSQPSEEILSKMGLHGGQIKIVARTKRSTTSHQAPIKPSFGKQGKINKN